MAGFIRGFSFDPGEAVLLEIESINILDIDPPSNITGVGTGTVLFVGEFEDGAYNVPTRLGGGSDLQRTFGGFGYTYNGVVANNPCARQRSADSAIVPEYWNGNGYIQLNAKRFKSLVCVRVDTSVGEVSFTRQAYITGLSAFSYNMEPGDILQLDVGAGRTSATFSATAAVMTSAAGTYSTSFTGGEYIDLSYDDAATVRVTFLAADQTQAQVISRINTSMGFTFAADATGGTTSLTSRKRGKTAKVQVVGASGAGVLTTLGFTATAVAGTGNVDNIDAVRFAEIKTIVELAIANTIVEQDSSGRLRISKVAAAATDYIFVGDGTTATALGFTVGQEGSADGYADFRSKAQTFPTTYPNLSTLTIGADNGSNVAVTLGTSNTQAQVITLINAALGYTAASSVSGTVMLLRGNKNGGQLRIVGASNALVISNLGLVVGTYTPATISAVQIPAGTEVQNTAVTNNFVTTQTITTSVSTAGPFKARVRHSLDDGSGVSASAGTIVSVKNAPDNGSFAVVNAANIDAALSEAAIDAQYTIAMNTTLAATGPATKGNLLYAARQSNVVRRTIKSNVIRSRELGLFGRMGVMRPPMNTLKSVATSTSAEPGCGSYRSQRVVYTYPNVSTVVPVMALRGLAGGTGFTSDGTLDVGADGFAVSVMSQLPPEENPGQANDFLDGIFGLESGANVQNFTIEDYTAFKAAGIMAPRMDEDLGSAVFQSGCTNVDPTLYPNLKNIARRRMGDFCEDTLARAMKPFDKKPNKKARRTAAEGEARAFYEALLSRGDENSQRIAGYTLDAKSRNTKASVAKGLFYIVNTVKNLSDMGSIVLVFTVGESVTVAEEIVDNSLAA